MSFKRRMVQRAGRLVLDMVPDDAKEAARRKLSFSIKAELGPELRAELHAQIKAELHAQLKAELHEQPKAELHEQLKAELHEQLKAELHEQLKAELHEQLKAELYAEIKAELYAQLKAELTQQLFLLNALPGRVEAFLAAVDAEKTANSFDVEKRALELRRLIRSTAGLADDVAGQPDAGDLLVEFDFLHAYAHILKPAFEALRSRRVLFCGQAYYNCWYLSRALRPLGWKADVYNWDANPATQIYYHGEDFRLGGDVSQTLEGELAFYLASLYGYDVFHFSNMHGIAYGWRVEAELGKRIREFANIHLLKALGKKIVYSNNGCMDGVSQTAFSKWGPESVCAICWGRDVPTVCSDERNLAWGKFRNSVADYQCTLGGNRADYNDDPRVHEVPEFYCLDPEFWRPDIDIPERYRLPPLREGAVRLYHAVGHREMRTKGDGVNIKSSHVYLPLVERLRADGMALELMEPTGIPNREVRFLQVQADIVLDMLTFGWFGANVREAMMLAKPAICYIRPEWLESVREEIPEYADELPIVSATPHTVEAVLRDLIAHPEKRREIGLRSREFALKWHSVSAAGKRLDQIYTRLLAGDTLLRKAAR
jgi:hypothetical protein